MHAKLPTTTAMSYTVLIQVYFFAAEHNYTFVMFPNGRSSVTSSLNLFIHASGLLL